jgi:FtsZ-binding cell division protein ZapB
MSVSGKKIMTSILTQEAIDKLKAAIVIAESKIDILSKQISAIPMAEISEDFNDEDSPWNVYLRKLAREIDSLRREQRDWENELRRHKIDIPDRDDD